MFNNTDNSIHAQIYYRTLVLIGIIIIIIIIIIIYSCIPCTQIDKMQNNANHVIMDMDTNTIKSESLDKDIDDDFATLFKCALTIPPDDLYV